MTLSLATQSGLEPQAEELPATLITSKEALNTAWQVHAAQLGELLAETGKWGLDDVLRGLVFGPFQGWVNGGAFIISQVIPYPKMRSLVGLWTVGALADVPVIVADAERWCRQNDIQQIEICGRPGWQRALKGFEPTGTLMRKVVSHG